MKVIAISNDGNFYKIGEDDKSAQWYGKTPTVEQFLKNIKKGDIISIKSEKKNGKNILTYISKAPASVTSHTGNDRGSGSGGYGSKSPEESEKIKRLSILSSTCNAVSALTGQLDANVLPDYIESLYDRLYKKISA